MSALGHKRTCAQQKVMSALPLIATSIAFFGMSALGQKRTFNLVVTPARNHPIFAQRTPNQISEMKIVSTDMPVEMTTAGDTVLKYTLYC
jgi:hypothetical protein